LRGQHEQRALQRVALAADRHLVLLHRLEQRRLGLGRRAVDLVGEDDVGEDRAGDEADGACAGGPILLDHLGAEDVRRHQVGRELDAAELQVDGVGECLDQQRLGQPRHAAQQAMAAGEERGQDLLDDRVLADDHLPQLPLQGADQLRGFRQGHRLGRGGGVGVRHANDLTGQRRD
jgi:hypothetical protein